MDEKISSASFQGKSKFTLPKGAKIIKKDHSVRVEEIENGFIISKSYDIKYQIEDRNEYEYFTKQWFSKDNPLEINIDDEGEDLADKLD